MRLLFFFLVSFVLANVHAQDHIAPAIKPQANHFKQVQRYTYTKGKTSYEEWFHGQTTDSIKTYHKTGQLDEVFYFLNNKYHGNAYKYTINGEKLTSWTFDQGKLIKRVDHKLRYNQKDKAQKKLYYKRLDSLNTLIISNPKDNRSKFLRHFIRFYLGDNILSLKDLEQMERHVKKVAHKKDTVPNPKTLSKIYDKFGVVYRRLGMENHSSHFTYKALKNDPENLRLKHNLGVYLYDIKSYKLSEYFLNRVLDKWPDHGFSHRVLSAIYSDYEAYEKAKQHIDLAFLQEKNLLKYGFGHVERDIRTLRGFILHKLGNTQDGIKDLKEAIRLNKTNSYAHRTLGVLYYDIKAYEKACHYLKKARTLHYETLHDKNDLDYYLQSSCNTQTESKPVALIPLQQKPFIHPNPTLGEVHVKNIAFKDFKYTVFNYAGALVQQGLVTGKTLDISELPEGVYILNISKGSNKNTFRVIKD